MPPSRPDLLAAALDCVSRALTRHGIWHALAYGTLLGAVRDGDVIPWDYDVDFFVRPADLRRILALNPDVARDRVEFTRSSMSPSVLAVNPRHLTSASGPRLRVRYEGQAVGDLYAFSLFSDGVLRWYDVEHEAYWCPESTFPHYFLETLETAEIRGRAYPVPRAAHKWLEYVYGSGWRRPFKAGDARTDEINVWGYAYKPTLADAIAWCEAQGWDRSRYDGEPHWPRAIAAAGPKGWAPRGEDDNQVLWWRTLEDLVLHY